MRLHLGNGIELAGLVVMLLAFPGLASGQCGGGGGTAAAGQSTLSNSSGTTLGSATVPGYPSTNSAYALSDHYRQFQLMQAQYQTIGLQMAANQAAQQAAYEALARPYRLANAAAKREAFERRKAARLAAQKSSSNPYLATRSP